MPADQLLNTVLRAYQDAPDPSQTDKILGSTITLLTSLNNPLNLSLITSHFLIARSIWGQPDGLRTCLRALSVYNTAANRVRRNELDNAKLVGGQLPVGSSVRAEDWARAIAKGLDGRSSRWQHALVLTGILVGMQSEDGTFLSRSLRSTLEQAVVTAANLALEDRSQTGALGKGAVVLALTYAFPLLSGAHKAMLNGNVLLPAVVDTMLGDEGFQHGEFIRAIESDLGPVRNNMDWPVNSPSVHRIQGLESRPLAQSMGPLSRLGAFAVEHAGDANMILHIQDELLSFTAGLLAKWQHCALSLVDLSVESTKLSPEVLRGPWPMLWQLLRKIVFATVAILQPIVGRCLLDRHLHNDIVAPTLAAKTLHILRNVAFISSRQGGNVFQIYVFTYLTSLDILTRYPDACIHFLEETLPPQTDIVPSPIHQALTLFYLNTAEHLTLSLPTPSAEALIVVPATANISPTSWLASPANTPPSALTLELFEASHAALLSVFACPQHSTLTASIVPFYIDNLLSSFPARISPRQFRLAFRTVMQVASPSYPISATNPELSETLLEMLRFRAQSASTEPLPPTPETSGGNKPQDPMSATGLISEQTALVLALIDALPYLPKPLIHEWLSQAGEASNAIADPRMRNTARQRLWEVLATGTLDVDRAVSGVAWWGTHGGRELVSGGEQGGGDFMMSGALAQAPRESSRL
ncbi:peroxin 8 [Xylaria sp. CBS 124048]|nr:peroxin 8 [Xylaria sp. CBS 124048]